MSTTGKDRFRAVLTEQFEQLFKMPAIERPASRFTPQSYADMFIAGLLDGPAIKNTCAALGIKNTYKSIREYLQS